MSDMSEQSFTIGRNDRSPSFRYQLLDGANQPVDLALLASVQIHISDRDGNVIVNQPAVMEMPLVDGNVRYDWEIGDTGKAGDFDVEFAGIYVSSGLPETWPNDDEKIPLKIGRDLA